MLHTFYHCSTHLNVNSVKTESDWLNSTAGQYLQAKEQALYDQAVFDLFGFNAVQMAVCKWICYVTHVS